MSVKRARTARQVDAGQKQREISAEAEGRGQEVMPSEQELLAAHPAAPDERVWGSHEELFAAENSNLVRFARGVARLYELPSAFAEDAVQDAWEKLLVHWENVKRPLPWMYTVVRRNVQREYERKASRRSRKELEDVEEHATWVSRARTTDAHDAYALNLALRAVDELPEQQRAVLLLSAIADRPYDEIAAIMGVSTGTVGAHAHRARGALRTRLGNFGTFVLIVAAAAGVVLRPAEPAGGQGVKTRESASAVLDDVLDDESSSTDVDDEPLSALRRKIARYERLRPGEDGPDPLAHSEHEECANTYLDSYLAELSREARAALAATLQEVAQAHWYEDACSEEAWAA